MLQIVIAIARSEIVVRNRRNSLAALGRRSWWKQTFAGRHDVGKWTSWKSSHTTVIRLRLSFLPFCEHSTRLAGYRFKSRSPSLPVLLDNIFSPVYGRIAKSPCRSLTRPFADDGRTQSFRTFDFTSGRFRPSTMAATGATGADWI